MTNDAILLQKGENFGFLGFMQKWKKGGLPFFRLANLFIPANGQQSKLKEGIMASKEHWGENLGEQSAKNFECSFGGKEWKNECVNRRK